MYARIAERYFLMSLLELCNVLRIYFRLIIFSLISIIVRLYARPTGKQITSSKFIFVWMGFFNQETSGDSFSTWWRHQMEAFSSLLALCAGNSPVTSKFPSQRPVTRSFDVFLWSTQSKRLSKRSRRRWFEMPSRSLWRHCTEMMNCFSTEIVVICGRDIVCYFIVLRLGRRFDSSAVDASVQC